MPKRNTMADLIFVIYVSWSGHNHSIYIQAFYQITQLDLPWQGSSTIVELQDHVSLGQIECHQTNDKNILDKIKDYAPQREAGEEHPSYGLCKAGLDPSPLYSRPFLLTPYTDNVVWAGLPCVVCTRGNHGDC